MAPCLRFSLPLASGVARRGLVLEHAQHSEFRCILAVRRLRHDQNSAPKFPGRPSLCRHDWLDGSLAMIHFSGRRERYCPVLAAESGPSHGRSSFELTAVGRRCWEESPLRLPPLVPEPPGPFWDLMARSTAPRCAVPPLHELCFLSHDADGFLQSYPHPSHALRTVATRSTPPSVPHRRSRPHSPTTASWHQASFFRRWRNFR